MYLKCVVYGKLLNGTKIIYVVDSLASIRVKRRGGKWVLSASGLIVV